MLMYIYYLGVHEIVLFIIIIILLLGFILQILLLF